VNNTSARKVELFLQIPLRLMRVPRSQLSFGAKCLYGRLQFYSGKNGVCNPSHKTLAYELGVSGRHVRKLLTELRKAMLLTWKQTRSSCSFTVHSFDVLAASDRNESSALDRNSGSNEGGTAVPTKRCLSKEASVKDVKADTDCLPTNRKNRDSFAEGGLPASQCEHYPDVKEAVARYMAEVPDHPANEDYPTDRKVLEIMDAAGGATEADVVLCMEHLFNERGLRPGTKHGPRSFAWFPAVVKDHFDKKRAREDASGYGRDSSNIHAMSNDDICRDSAVFDPASDAK